VSDYFLPLDIAPSSQKYAVRDLSAIFTSVFTGAQRTVQRPRLLTCSLVYEGLNAVQRHRLVGLVAQLARGDRVYVPDYATALRGSFPASELLSNTSFSSTTGWSSSNAEVAIGTDSGRLRLTRTAVAADRFVSSAAVTTTSGLSYLFRAGVLQGRGAPRFGLGLGTATATQDLVAGSMQTAEGVNHVVAAATGASTYAVLRDYIGGGRTADYFQVLDQPSLARCALVNGASQTGTSLWIDALPASVTDLMLAGDTFAVYTTAWEQKRLVMDLKSNASGQGQLVFDPPLRNSPSDNAPVAIYRPMAKFILTTDEVSWETRAGLFSDFQLDFVEDIA